jgi:hypothetical protein
MSGIFFTSLLGNEYRAGLEELMFFNPQQGKVKTGIVASIERYGLPQIFLDGKFLRVKVQEFSEVQTLFALDGRADVSKLVGVVVYVRTNVETITILHIGVDEQYSISGLHAGEMLVVRMIAQLREIARRIKGIRSLVLIYGKGAHTRIPI